MAPSPMKKKRRQQRISTKSLVRCGEASYELTRMAVIVTRVANTETFTVMPTFDNGTGLECVALSSWQKWLSTAVGAIVKEDTDIIASFVADLRKLLERDNDAAAAPADTPLEEAGAEQATLGRASLGIDDDSDNADFTRLRPQDVAKVRRLARKRKTRDRLEFRTVTLDDVVITAKMRPRGTGIVIPNDGQIPKILKAVQGRLSQGSNSDVEARASKRAARHRENKAAVTKPNLRYTSTGFGGIYTIWWKDGEGMMHSKRFSMSRTDVSGLMLEPARWAELRESVRRQALKLWNDLDVSDQPRLDVPEESTDNEIP